MKVAATDTAGHWKVEPLSSGPMSWLSGAAAGGATREADIGHRLVAVVDVLAPRFDRTDALVDRLLFKEPHTTALGMVIDQMTPPAKSDRRSWLRSFRGLVHMSHSDGLVENDLCLKTARTRLVPTV